MSRAALLLAAALGLPAPSPGGLAATPLSPLPACDVAINVTDQDPAGLNVRRAPGGAVIGALKARGRWVQVHVTGDAGGWARIDGADLIPEETGEPAPLSNGQGYVAFSKLGIEALQPGGRILAAPVDDARAIVSLPREDESHLPHAEVLGCSGSFLKVRVQGRVGWTRDFCANQFTTCV